MRTFSVIAFAFVFSMVVLGENPPFCGPRMCSDLGEICYPTRNINCKSGLACQRVGKFPEEHGTCIRSLLIGANCSSTSTTAIACSSLDNLSCVQSSTYNTTNPITNATIVNKIETCHVKLFKAVGEQCTADYQCSTGKCLSPQSDCAGFALGETCTTTQTCGTDLVCNSLRKCDNIKNIGDSCAAKSSECGPWDIQCIPTTANTSTGTCQPFQSVPIGGACYLDNHCNLDTAYCATPAGWTTGICTKINYPSLRSCASNPECPSGETCACDYEFGGNGRCVPTTTYGLPIKGYSQITTDAFACARQHHCRLIASGTYYPTSCTFANCRKEWGCYESIKWYMTQNKTYDPCNLEPFVLQDVHYSKCLPEEVVPPVPTTSTTSSSTSSTSSGSPSSTTQHGGESCVQSSTAFVVVPSTTIAFVLIAVSSLL